MKKWIALAASLGLAGCASTICDSPWSRADCQTERLLYQNDLLQAKILVSSGDLESLELAEALLDRAARDDETGETAFYKAVLLIRLGPQPDEVLELLEKAVARGHPHATALMYKIYSEPFLVSQADPVKAGEYRADYARLDVAKSGYPSFERALALVDALVAAPPESVSPADPQ
jgi:hypothetical protein